MTRRSLIRQRRGSAAVLIAALMVVLIGAGAVAVDVGYQRVVGEQLQAGLDAAAIAASNQLDVSPTAARSAAITMAGLNTAGTDSIVITGSDVVIGKWDATAGTFSTLSGSAESTGNAVRVTSSVNDVPTFLARAFGVSSLSVARTAVAGTTGSGVANCGVLAATTATISGNWSADTTIPTSAPTPQPTGRRLAYAQTAASPPAAMPAFKARSFTAAILGITEQFPGLFR